MNRRHYTGIFCLSLATLLLELVFTRVLSVANWYHFGFLVISMALLGFGASGVVLTLWTKLRETASFDRNLAIFSLSFGTVTLVSYWLMQHIPFEPFQLLLDPRQFFLMPLYYIVVAAPFFCSGLAIGLLLFRGREYAERLYAVDLLGAAVGCAAIAGVMPLFGASGSVVVAAAVGFLAASVLALSRPKHFPALPSRSQPSRFPSPSRQRRRSQFPLAPENGTHYDRRIATLFIRHGTHFRALISIAYRRHRRRDGLIQDSAS